MESKKTKTKKRIKVYCENGSSIFITKTRLSNIKTQMTRDIKAKRAENKQLIPFYFYGLAYFVYYNQTDSVALLIEYGDELSSRSIDKKNKIYVEVPYKTRTTKKNGTIVV